MKLCDDCGKPKSRKGIYCKNCGYKHRTRPTGLRYVLHKENPTSFKKGHVSWNKGLLGIMKANIGSFKKGEHKSKETEFKKGSFPWNKNKEFLEIRGERHANWKGNGVGYQALHSWVKKRLTKPTNCVNCREVKKLNLANKSGNYKRDLSDWLWLCDKCHHKRDNIANKGWKTRKAKAWLTT